MGKVYRVLDKKLNEEVALKLIKPEIASDKKTLERFKNELKLARKISQKNVGRMFDLNEEAGTHYITMEYVPGEDLKSFMRRSGQLNIATAIRITKQICEGLSEAHGIGIVHRDLKPSNIMIDKKGNVRIVDFGIAQFPGESGLTGEGVIIGTPDYMSPEQADGQDVDARSDIYSFGTILYEMVTGRVPFEGASPFSVAMKHRTATPLPPKKLNPQIPVDLNRLILRCLEKAPDQRYQIAEDVLADIEVIEKSLPTSERTVQKRKSAVSKAITVKLIRKKNVFPGFVLLAAAIIGIFLWRVIFPKQMPLVSSSTPSLAVLPFENISKDESLDVWRDSLFVLMFTDIFQSRFINVLADDQIYEILQELDLQHTDKFTSNDLARIGKRGEISYITRGSIIRVGENIILSLIVQKADDGKILGAAKFECQSDKDLSSKVDEMTLEVKKALRLDPKQISVDYDSEVETITSNSPKSLKHYREGRIYHVSGDWEKSIECMRKAIELDPDFAMAYRSMGAALGNLGFFREQRDALKKALELSDSVPLRERLLIQGFALNDAKEKLEAYQKVLEIYPFDGAANESLGTYYGTREYYAKALEYREAAVKNNFINPLSIHNLVLAYLNNQKYDEAEKFCLKYYDLLSKSRQRSIIISVFLCQGKYDRALEEAKKLEDSSERLLGWVFLLREDFDEAEDKYRELLDSKEERDQFDGRMHLSDLYLTQGKFERAEEELRIGLEIGEHSKQDVWLWNAFSRLIKLKLALGQASEALKEWNDYKGSFPGYYSTWLMDLKAKILLIVKDFKGADEIIQIFKENLNKWIEWQGTNKHLRYWYYLLGFMALEQNKSSESIAYLKDAVSLLAAGEPKDYALFMNTLAIAYTQAGELDKAQIEYERISRFTTEKQYAGDIYARSYYMLGKIFEHQSEKSRARINYEKFLDLWKDADPGLPEVQDARKRLAGLKGN